MKKLFAITPIILLSLNLIGCATDLKEPSSEFDTRGEIIAIVSPDSVQSGRNFTVQISFPNICGGTFSQMNLYNISDGIILEPVIHVVPQQVCPAVFSVRTVTTQLNVTRQGQFTLIARGSAGDLRKNTQIVPNVSTGDKYMFRFLFMNEQRRPVLNRSIPFYLPDKIPISMGAILSDSFGVWQTTLPETGPQLRYILAGITFTAQRGIKEDGTILLP